MLDRFRKTNNKYINCSKLITDKATRCSKCSIINVNNTKKFVCKRQEKLSKILSYKFLEKEYIMEEI